MSWYIIDATFYSNIRPDGINDTELSRPQTRPISINEIFEETEIDQNQNSLNLFSLDLFYRPQERGSYNYNPLFETQDPQQNFAGITRALTTTNFEQSNVEFIEFWLMDPYDSCLLYTSPSPRD